MSAIHATGRRAGPEIERERTKRAELAMKDEEGMRDDFERSTQSAYPNRMDPEGPSAELTGRLLRNIEDLERNGMGALKRAVRPAGGCDWFIGRLHGYFYLLPFIERLSSKDRDRVADAAVAACQRLEKALKQSTEEM